jgi:extracellular elastinolytic metalloproteinase
VAKGTRNGRKGMRHLEMEQRVQGMAVHGSHLRAAIDRDGRVLQVIDGTKALGNGAVRPAQIDAAQALRAAMARVHPGVAAVAKPVARDGHVTTFDKPAFFHQAPKVEAVAVAQADGSLAQAWQVQTWSARDGRLFHTVVSGEGKVLAVQNRTAEGLYNVFPTHPGVGPQTVIDGPGPQPGGPVSPQGWLGRGIHHETLITGNNTVTGVQVADYEEIEPELDPGTGAIVGGGRFLQQADLTQQPTTAVNQRVAVQNAFFHVNKIHDVLWRLGFDESAGNFQKSNFSRGGVEGDPMIVRARQRGLFNNAFITTPPDGQKPMMVFGLFEGPLPRHELAITSPEGRIFDAQLGRFSWPPRLLDPTAYVGPITGMTPASGCDVMPAGSLAGQIALADRGGCNFLQKAARAKGAGAKALVVVNTSGGDEIFYMSGFPDSRALLPGILISQNSGAALRAMAAPVGAVRAKAVQPLYLDAALDADVIYHEYGHGLTWRMVGAMDGLLSGAVGEGASDVLAFLMTDHDVIGEYVAQRPASGVRRYRYASYPLTYADVNGASLHADGEIYAAAMWRLYELMGPARREDLLAYFVDGLNYTRPDPSHEHMRDGLLQAVANGPQPADRCAVWSAFAQFGIGVGASGIFDPDFYTVAITPSTAKPADCP